MKKLRDLIEFQQLTHKEDFEIIVEWLKDNDLSVQGLDMIYALAREEINNLKKTHQTIMSDLMVYDCFSMIKEYGIEIAQKLNTLIVKFICKINLTKNDLEWLKVTIPTLKKPNVFWNNFKDFLESNNIFFKED